MVHSPLEAVNSSVPYDIQTGSGAHLYREFVPWGRSGRVVKLTLMACIGTASECPDDLKRSPLSWYSARRGDGGNTRLYRRLTAYWLVPMTLTVIVTALVVRSQVLDRTSWLQQLA